MKCIFSCLSSAIFLIMPFRSFCQSQLPEIHNIQPLGTVVGQFEKFECNVDFTANYENPYDYDQIHLKAIFTSPNEKTIEVDGFYMEGFSLDLLNGSLSGTGNAGFKVRFSPNESGQWTYVILVTDKTGTTMSAPYFFRCETSSNSLNKGFAKKGSSNYLQVENEEQLILVGENAAWQNSNPYLDYNKWLLKLSENGGNFIRLWHAHWGLGIEWKDQWNGFLGLRQYKQSNCYFQDWLFDFCAEKGIYVMLTLQHHGPVSTSVNSNWEDSPYNAVNGGPCQNTWDFFTNQVANSHTQNRYRYIIARWGYSRSILAWELFNEVDWTDDFDNRREEVQDWHADMASFIKSIDPYQHLLTTSYAHDNEDPNVWLNEDIDFTQTHYYVNTSNIENVLSGGISKYLLAYQKPTLNGEFGLGADPILSNRDPNGIHVHNALWGSLFSGGLGTAMTWWWDTYVDPNNLYYHFNPISIFANEVAFAEYRMKPATTYVTGAPGDLVLNTNLGWSAIADNQIIIEENGITSPDPPGLGQFLYGSQWNTQFRSPPTFTVSYPESGTFSVKTNNETGQDPKISIYLDGVLVLDEVGMTNKTYSIDVPAGDHTIKVDNSGTDWISIDAYLFSGIGSLVDAYTLVGEGKENAAGWVLNRQYNHEYIAENGFPAPVASASLVVNGLSPGDYLVKWHDCLTGAFIQEHLAASLDSQLMIPLPELYWDMAFKVSKADVTASDFQAGLKEWEVFPNPVREGTVLNISGNLSAVQIFSNDGKPLGAFTLNDSQKFSQIQIPGDWPAGMYWISAAHSNGSFASKPLVIVR